MTVIRPNSISGITSLTAHRGSIDFYAHDGSAATFNNINSNVTSGVSTFASLNITGDLDVGGALTYEDVTNIDSVGIVTAQAGIDITGGDLTIPDKIIHSGDTNTSIRFPASDTIRLSTSGSSRLNISPNGYVLLGTNSEPSGGDAHALNAKLLVQGRIGNTADSGRLNLQRGSSASDGSSLGSISFTDNSNNAYARIETFGDATPGNSSFPGRITFSTTNDGASTPTEKLRITSGGQVNIGGDLSQTGFTANITRNSSETDILRIKGNAGNAFIRFQDNDSSSIYTIGADDAVGGGGFMIYDRNVSAYRLVLSSGGNIGIGENSPYYKLHLKTNNNATSLSGGGGGNWGGDGIRIENQNTTVGSMSLAHFRTYDADWHIGNKYVTANNSDFIFSSEGSEKLRITSDGKMGVGTDSPNHRLTLHNSGTGTFDALNITSGLTNSVGLQFGIDSSSNVFLWHTANGGIKFATNNVERMRVTNNGITFNGDTAADNALDDYEQGTWNPVIAFGGSSTGVGYNEREGIYVKIGNLVWASMVIALNNNGSGTGDISISLPFAVGNNSENRGIGTVAYFAGFAGLNSNPNVYSPSGGSTTCRLQHLNNSSGSGTQVTTLAHGNVGNSAAWRAAVMYTTI